MSPSREPTWYWPFVSGPAFDLVQGDLTTLRTTGGDFTAALDAMQQPACLADDLADDHLLDPNGAPAPGEGVFVLLRPVALVCPAAGSYDSGVTLFADRDEGIAAASTSCP